MTPTMARAPDVFEEPCHFCDCECGPGAGSWIFLVGKHMLHVCAECKPEWEWITRLAALR